MSQFSKHMCNSGLRDAAFPVFLHGIETVRQQLADGHTEEGLCWTAACSFLEWLRESGHDLRNPEGTAAFVREFCRAAADAVTDAITEGYRSVDMDDVLPAVARDLDDFVDNLLKDNSSAEEAAFERGYDSGWNDGRADGHEDGYDEGHEDGSMEVRPDTPYCPTCLRQDTFEECRHDRSIVHCAQCETEFRLVPFALPMLAFPPGRDVMAHTPEPAPVTAQDYLRRCGLESGPLSAAEER